MNKITVKYLKYFYAYMIWQVLVYIKMENSFLVLYQSQVERVFGIVDSP